MFLIKLKLESINNINNIKWKIKYKIYWGISYEKLFFYESNKPNDSKWTMLESQ